MSDDATTANTEAVVTAVIDALQNAFGARECSVVERQFEAASEEALASWTTIVARLRSDQDHL